MMSARRKNIIICLASLVLGGLLYVLFRSDTHIAKAAYRLVPFLQQFTIAGNERFSFVRYYYLDFLWTLSLGCGLTAVFTPKIKGAICCGAAAFLCGAVWELLQWVCVVEGTADWLDIMMYLTAWGIAVVINMIGVDTNEKMD